MSDAQMALADRRVQSLHQTHMLVTDDISLEGLCRGLDTGPIPLAVRTVRGLYPDDTKPTADLRRAPIENIEVLVMSIHGKVFRCLVGSTPGVILRAGNGSSAFWLIRLYDTD
jgi:hypothetical protein